MTEAFNQPGPHKVATTKKTSKVPPPKQRRKRERLQINAAWFEERIDAINTSRARLSKEFGRHENTFGRILEGQLTPVPEALVFLATKLQVPIREIFEHLGFPMPAPACPIIGKVNSRGFVELYPTDKQKATTAPTETDAGFVAVEVDAPHSPLQLYHGTLLFYRPSTGVRLDAFGRLCVLEVGDRPAPIVGNVDRASQGYSTIVVYGGIDRFELRSEEVISTAPIRWTRLG